MLRRALLLALGCGTAAYAVPQYFGELGLDSVGEVKRAPAAPPQIRDAVAPPEPGTESYRARQGNQFFVEATVDGHPVHFVVDTGATLVSLTPADARAIGFDLDQLDWSVKTETANGNGLNARVVLKELRLGSIAEFDVPAIVMRAPGSPSLLGMSFLSRLRSWEIRDGVLTIAS